MTKFSSKLSPKLVSRFLDELALINGKYGYATDPLEKRVRWIEELELLGRIAREIHPVIKLLLEPLDALITALYVLEHGVAEPPLQPAKLKHRPQDPNWSYFRGGAAAASELLIGHGAAASVADAWVAKRLSRDGHQKPFGNSDRRITAVTVKGWRKEARERGPRDVVRVAYETLLEADHSKAYSAEEALAVFRECFHEIVHDRTLANTELMGVFRCLTVIAMINASVPSDPFKSSYLPLLPPHTTP